MSPAMNLRTRRMNGLNLCSSDVSRRGWSVALMLALVPVYSAVVARWPRRVFLPWLLRAFALWRTTAW